ncbi:MAG TPA: phosphate signaling complex protein PhoU [Thermoanaerobaculia bacterium]|nr:phosphate signaling complex protein PhoU [Thermoanaerobaculia bacterium]
MDRPLDHDLDRLRHDLLRMGDLVDGMVRDSMRALLEADVKLAERVIRGDEAVDLLEKNLDEASHGVLARQQPMASDLRFLVAVMRMTGNLERVGDAAVNIAQAVEQLVSEPPLEPYIDLRRMAELARGQIRASLDAFRARDPEAALEVCRRDDEIDHLYEQLFRILVTYMIESPRNVRRALHLLLIARNLERVADHATNLAEDVVYYAAGLDIRHAGARA